jgi:hypothetical protein
MPDLLYIEIIAIAGTPPTSLLVQSFGYFYKS